MIFLIDEGDDDDNNDFWIETMKTSFKFQIKSKTKIKKSTKIWIKPNTIKKRCKNYIKLYQNNLKYTAILNYSLLLPPSSDIQDILSSILLLILVLTIVSIESLINDGVAWWINLEVHMYLTLHQK